MVSKTAKGTAILNIEEITPMALLIVKVWLGGGINQVGQLVNRNIC